MSQGQIICTSLKASLLQDITRHKILISEFYHVTTSSSLLARETSLHFTKFLLFKEKILYSMRWKFLPNNWLTFTAPPVACFAT